MTFRNAPLIFYLWGWLHPGLNKVHIVTWIKKQNIDKNAN